MKNFYNHTYLSSSQTFEQQYYFLNKIISLDRIQQLTYQMLCKENIKPYKYSILHTVSLKGIAQTVWYRTIYTCHVTHTLSCILHLIKWCTETGAFQQIYIKIIHHLAVHIVHRHTGRHTGSCKCLSKINLENYFIEIAITFINSWCGILSSW